MTRRSGQHAPPSRDFDHAPPEAASLIESLRAFGYQLPTAVADLVDNSVSAGAKRIWLDFHWAGADSVVVLTDDGAGMEAHELVAAMRPGSRSPREQRAVHDLGRFGLGLKTASFSQCRRVSVRSKTSKTPPVTRCWDLDHVARVNDWQLLRSADGRAEPHFSRFETLPHGTAVVWQEMDSLTGGFTTENPQHHDVFLRAAEAAGQHLGVAFQRLMVSPPYLQIYLNDRPVLPWDPFLVSEPATQILPTTSVTLRGAVMTVQPYVLPHHSKVSKAVHARAAGPRGWNAHQGFYIYRQNRLLVAGDWLGFGWAKEEHYKLARIAVDIPNALDLDWNIDVTKSKATPPPAIRGELRAIAERCRADAKRVYSHRGARLTPTTEGERTLLWHPIAKHGKTFYRLNRQHPMLLSALASSANRAALTALLRMIEETVPFPHITISSSERPDSLPAPFEYESSIHVRKVMEEAFHSLVASGYGRREAVDRLKTLWPFELFPELVAGLAEEADDA